MPLFLHKTTMTLEKVDLPQNNRVERKISRKMLDILSIATTTTVAKASTGGGRLVICYCFIVIAAGCWRRGRWCFLRVRRLL